MKKFLFLPLIGKCMQKLVFGFVKQDRFGKLAVSLSSFSLAALFGQIDPNGWASVERPKKTPFEESLEERDRSVWVVFTKVVGEEKFFVRFPNDPSYTYLPQDELEIVASEARRECRLQVLSPKEEGSCLEKRGLALSSNPEILLVEERLEGDIGDFLYYSNGKWVWERLLKTAHHLYFFQTKSDDLSGDFHRQFVSSFEVDFLAKD